MGLARAQAEPDPILPPAQARVPITGELAPVQTVQTVQTVQPVQTVQTVQHPSWAWDEKLRPKNEPQLFVEPWVMLARFEQAEGREPPGDGVVDGVVFSTFPLGQEPDTWPEIETAAPWWRAAVAGLLAALAAWAAWLTLRPAWSALVQRGIRRSGERRAGAPPRT